MRNMTDFNVYRGELFIEREEPLSNENIKFIQRTINKIPLLAIFITVIGLTIMLLAGAGLIAYGISAVVLLMIFVLFIQASKKYRDYIAAGRKKVLRGILTEKEARHSNDDLDSMKEYFFQVDLRKLEVDLPMYNSYQVGEAIEVHFIGPGPNPQSTFILEHTKISRDKSTW